MVKRVVDTAFWTDMEVIDHYSPEDKFFYLYLITNGKSTQVGIYSLPVKVISFETGYSTETVKVLIERFSEKYKQIIYSEKTQEVTILKSLQFSILKGGKPVSDLLEKELSRVKDGELIQQTYQDMRQFWMLSKRPFDKVIQELFEIELSNRGLMDLQHQSKNESKNKSKNENNSKSKDENQNEESWPANRGANREEVETDEKKVLQRFADTLKTYNPDLENTITSNNIVKLYYQEMIGEVHQYIDTQLKHWEKKVPKTLVLEAISRSLKASQPLPYANRIIDNWVGLGVKTYKDLIALDKTFNQETF